MALVTVQRSPTPSTTSSPCVSETDSGEDDRRSQPRSISESFLTVKGAALFLPRGNGSSPSSVPRITQRRNKHTGDLQQHLQTMFTLLRPEDNIRLAVRLESAYPQCTRYMVVVSTNGRQDTEESVVLGMDFTSSNHVCTVGLVLPLWSDTLIHLDGDGGFSVSTVNRVHVFKPVSVQAMWSALQSLHKACEVARCHNYYPGSLFLTWVSYYQSRVTSDQHCINEWNAMQDVQSHRADSPVLFTDVPTERERTERLIKTRLREIMMQKDLENVTSKEIRTELEMQMVCNLREFKEYIDNEMIVILGQMDSPTEIFDHVYLGSEWNASNLEELQKSGVQYILNVTREIDNFFPGMFEYHNIRVYDEEATNLLEYWNDTYKFISKAKKAGSKCLVHCKMGVSRSASTVIAYAMKEYGWDLGRAFEYVKERRAVTKPNPAFMKQLEEYQGILLASKQRHNKLWRSHSDSDLSDRHKPPAARTPHTVGRSDPRNDNTAAAPSLHHILSMAGMQSEPQPDRGREEADFPAPTPTAAPTSNGLCEDGPEHLPPSTQPASEDPFLPPLPRPRAATVVPEERMDSSVLTVAVTVPVARPHPPPSLHMLPPSPLQPQPDLTTTDGPLQPSSPVPEQNTDLVELSTDVPDISDCEVSYQQQKVSENLQLYLDAVSEGNKGLPSSETPMAVSPSGAPLALGLEPDGANPSEGDESYSTTPPPGHDGSSNLSTDRIDFFSAREKFAGLAQDSAARSCAESSAPRISHSRCLSQEPPPTLEEPSSLFPDETYSRKGSPHPDEHCDRSPVSEVHPDNGVSVRHIVTELESISNPVPAQPLTAPRSPQHPKSQEDVSQPPSSPDTPPPTQSPLKPTADWPSGSVRRVTKQLEQRLREELEGPSACTATHIPTSDPTNASPLNSPCLNCPEQLNPTSEADCSKGEVCSEAQEACSVEAAAEEELRKLSDEEVSTSQGPSFPQCHNSRTLSPVTGCPSLEPRAEPTLLWLEGVTGLETDTDGPTPPHGRLACSSEDLVKIQETLRELQAFLYEAGGLGGRSGTSDRAQGLSEHPGDPHPRSETRGPAVWQRAMEIEARIRQAGLTPPSLMKRSASLAKLDCLELSTNDLSDWDFHSASVGTQHLPAVSTFQRLAQPSPDDAFKKQRVLPQSSSYPGSGACAVDADRTVGSSPPSPPCPQHRQRCQPGPQDHAQSQPAAAVAVTTRQQQLLGKAHPLRRLRKATDKKRTVTVLYNTM
ncbi:protein phosphatase Slingshot homolog 2 isoform X2 [Denticeps clupeoides]|uniref:protein-serine/threonine phosphatase n=1 Tax=Denticeps clupeoides TaxID=299321 RepID=A0AAY4EUE3_9TELE|nr:protein phosphatase Slingshot homolog 2 isoform X2 [Denticeps clupeoides]